MRAAYVAADMAKPAEIRALIAEAAARFGGVDILVNNAGIQHVAKIVDFPEERWDAVIAINLSAAFHATKAALPVMIAKRLGPDHQHRLGARARRQRREGGLCHRQARPRRADQGHRDRDRQPGHHLQRDLPGLGADAAGAAADRGARPGGGHPGRAGARRPGAREAADARFHDPGEDRRAGGVPVRRRGLDDHRRGLSIDGGWVAQ